MKESNKWARFIKQRNLNRVNRAMRNLYTDMDVTVAFLQGLIELYVRRERDDYTRLITAQVRIVTQALPASKLESVLDRFKTTDEFMNLVVITLGSQLYESETSLVTISRLLEVVRRQTSVMVANTMLHSSALTALAVLMRSSARGMTHTWTNALFQAYAATESCFFRDFVTALCRGDLFYRVVPYSHTDEQYEILQYDGEQRVLAFPAPDDLVSWTKNQIDIWGAKLMSREEGFRRLSDELRSRFAEYRAAYEDMWLEMMVEPVWGMREGGLDCVRFSIPELRASGHRLVRLQPREPFPNFHATYTMEKMDGSMRQLEIDLEPSDLETVSLGPSAEGSILRWADRLLAFMAVRAAWMIVMGLTGRKSDGKWTKNGKSNTGAVIRPRFRHLPEGYHASPEARARALATFRKEPLPGFTFVKQYERGPVQNSGEPLFAVTDVEP